MRPLLAALALTVPLHAAALLEVVTTTEGLAALVREVGGREVRAVSLSRPTEDTHLVSSDPVLAAKLRDAALLVDVGLGLEAGWLPPLVVLSRNNEIVPGGRRRLTAADAIVPLEAPPAAHDRRGGELHPAGNPHFLADPRRAGQVAATIAGRLALLDPEHGKFYASSAEQFRTRLVADEARWKEQLAPFRGQAVVTEHDSMPYLLDWAGLVTAGHLEPEPGLPPSAAHLAALAREMGLHHVRAIVSEGCRDGRAAEILARRSGAREARLPCDVGAAPEASSYASHMDLIVTRLAAALRTLSGAMPPW